MTNGKTSSHRLNQSKTIMKRNSWPLRQRSWTSWLTKTFWLKWLTKRKVKSPILLTSRSCSSLKRKEAGSSYFRSNFNSQILGLVVVNVSELRTTVMLFQNFFQLPSCSSLMSLHIKKISILSTSMSSKLILSQPTKNTLIRNRSIKMSLTQSFK